MEISARIDHVSLAMHELDSAVRFYTEAFGYRLLFRGRQDEAIVTLTGVPELSCELAQLKPPGG